MLQFIFSHQSKPTLCSLSTGVLVLLQSEEYKQPQWHRVTGKFTSYYSPVYTDKIESVQAKSVYEPVQSVRVNGAIATTIGSSETTIPILLTNSFTWSFGLQHTEVGNSKLELRNCFHYSRFRERVRSHGQPMTSIAASRACSNQHVAPREITWPGQVSVATPSLGARGLGRGPNMTGDTPAVSGSSKYQNGRARVNKYSVSGRGRKYVWFSLKLLRLRGNYTVKHEQYSCPKPICKHSTNGMAHLNLIQLLCVPRRHQKLQRRACIASCMLSCSLCQTLHELARNHL